MEEILHRGKRKERERERERGGERGRETVGREKIERERFCGFGVALDLRLLTARPHRASADNTSLARERERGRGTRGCAGMHVLAD